MQRGDGCAGVVVMYWIYYAGWRDGPAGSGGRAASRAVMVVCFFRRPIAARGKRSRDLWLNERARNVNIVD